MAKFFVGDVVYMNDDRDCAGPMVIMEVRSAGLLAVGRNSQDKNEKRLEMLDLFSCVMESDVFAIMGENREQDNRYWDSVEDDRHDEMMDEFYNR